MQLSLPTTDSVFWALVILALGAAIAVSLFYLSIPLDVLLVLVLCGLGVLYVSGRPAYSVVFLVVLFSIFINNANYTFFTHSASGAQINQSAEARLLVLMRLPFLFFAVGLVLARCGARFIRFLSANWDVVVFSLLPFASLFFSLEKSAALKYGVWFSFSIFTILAFVYLLGMRVSRERWGEHVAWVLLLASLPIVMLALSDVPGQLSGRFRASYNSSNFYAYSCAIVFVALLVLERQRGIPNPSRYLKKTPFVMLLGLGLATLVPLFLSAKRSTIAAAAIALLVYMFSSSTSLAPGKKMATFMRSVLVIVALVAVVWTILPYARVTTARFERVFDSSIEDASLEERQYVWEASLQAVSGEGIVFGVGLANGSTAAMMVTKMEEAAGLHSTLLAILVEMGVIGSIFFLIMVVRSVYLFHTSCPPFFRWNLVLLAIPPALAALTEYNLTPGQAMFWPLWIAVLLPRVGMTLPQQQ